MMINLPPRYVKQDRGWGEVVIANTSFIGVSIQNGEDWMTLYFRLDDGNVVDRFDYQEGAA